MKAANGNGEWKRALLIAIGSGSGFGLAITLAFVVRSDPKAVLAILQQWGPMFVIAAGCLVMLDRRFSEFIAASRKTTAAQQQMADAVQAIAQKSDREGEEQRRLLSYVGSQMEKVLERQENIEAAIGRMGARHTPQGAGQ